MHIDPRKTDRFPIVANGIQCTSPMRRMEVDREANETDYKDHRTPRNQRTINSSEADVLIPIRKPTDSTLIQDDLSNAAIQRECADRDDQRRQPAVNHDQTVEQPCQGTGENTEQHGRLDPYTMLKTNRH